MKKFTAWLLALILTLSFTGCAQQSAFDPQSIPQLKNEYNQYFSGACYDGAWFDTTISEASHTSITFEYPDGCLNPSLAETRNGVHLPIYKMDTYREFKEFVQAAEQGLNLNYGSAYMPSFYEATKHFNRAFFKDHTLIVIYFTSSYISDCYRLNSILCDDTDFVALIEKIPDNDPDGDLPAMAGEWLFTITVPDGLIAEECTYFDAKKVRADYLD